MPIKLMEAYLKELAQVPIEGIIQQPWELYNNHG